MKKIILKAISASLVFCMIISSLSFNVFCNSFEDVDEHWAKEDIEKVADANIFYGITDNTFEPDSYVTRGMAAVIAGRMLSAVPGDRIAFFKDVDNNEYYAPYIAWAYEKQILTGYDDMTFRADLPVTREEMFSIMERVVKYKNDAAVSAEDFELRYADSDQISENTVGSVKFLSEQGYIHGNENNMIYAQRNATRAEFSTLVAKIMGLSERTIG